MSVDQYTQEWLLYWHKLLDPQGPPFEDEYSLVGWLQDHRDNQEMLREFFAVVPCGERMLERLLEIISATAAEPGNLDTLGGGAYLGEPRQHPAGDEELIGWARAFLTRAHDLTGEPEDDPNIEVVRSPDSDRAYESMVPDNVKQGIGDYGLSCIDDELVDLMEDHMPDDRARAASYVLTEPLYKLACSYDLAHFVLWSLVEETLGDNPFRPLFNLWRSGAGMEYVSESKVCVFAPEAAGTS